MSKIRESARGQECQVRIGDYCNRNPETTVLAHIGGGGMGAKSHDIHGAYCCSSCHDILDGRMPTSHRPDDLKLWHLEAVIRTQLMMLNDGLIKT